MMCAVASRRYIRWAALLLGTTALTSCALLDGGSPLEAALAYLPAGTTEVVFTTGDDVEDPATDVGITADDVVWEVRSVLLDEQPVVIWKLADDVDLEDLDQPGLTAVPDEQVLIRAEQIAADTVADVVRDDAESLADSGEFDDLIDHIPDIKEIPDARLARRGSICPADRTAIAEATATFTSADGLDLFVVIFADADPVRHSNDNPWDRVHLACTSPGA